MSASDVRGRPRWGRFVMVVPMPFDSDSFAALPEALQRKVRHTVEEIRTAAGAGRHVLGVGEIHGAVLELGQELYRVQHPTWQDAHTSDQLRSRIAALAGAAADLDRFTAQVRSELDIASLHLADLLADVEAEEKRRAADAVGAARRKTLEAEVSRMAAREDARVAAERRARLEQEAAERLGLAPADAEVRS